jgi:hypothetical protein
MNSETREQEEKSKNVSLLLKSCKILITSHAGKFSSTFNCLTIKTKHKSMYVTNEEEEDVNKQNGTKQNQRLNTLELSSIAIKSRTGSGFLFKV